MGLVYDGMEKKFLRSSKNAAITIVLQPASNIDLYRIHSNTLVTYNLTCALLYQNGIHNTALGLSCCI